MRKLVLTAVLATFTCGIVGCGDASAPAPNPDGPKPPGVPSSGPEAPKAPKASKAAKKH
ncbi:MAG: hypothetical protein P4L85_08995 [Paludisphaera borealis]|uniref:hypothetical protein n=1 Tax=Paludisphaera borealis TaxID=1387353 RepID=UPI002844ED57|nr:hypothetical protein [Paludisphaera borealis]MDR3619474.1 hypothetical protein [Paludisphaera borealis]